MNDKVMKHASHMHANQDIYFPDNPLSHDGYPNLSEAEINQVPVREIKWFIDRIGDHVFSASPSGYNGIVKIGDQSDAKDLYNSQNEGYRFLSLIERSRQALGVVYYNQAAGFQEPQLDKGYRVDFYINGVLQESNEAQYIGLTDNLKWYVFDYTNCNKDKHLLPVGNFPHYLQTIRPEVKRFEKYSSLSKTVGNE